MECELKIKAGGSHNQETPNEMEKKKDSSEDTSW